MGKKKGLTTPRKKDAKNGSAKIKKKKTRHSIFESQNNLFNFAGSADKASGSKRLLSVRNGDGGENAPLVEINLNLNAVDKWIGKPYLKQLSTVFKNTKLSELAEEYLRPYLQKFQKKYLGGMISLGIECNDSKSKLLLPAKEEIHEEDNKKDDYDFFWDLDSSLEKSNRSVSLPNSNNNVPKKRPRRNAVDREDAMDIVEDEIADGKNEDVKEEDFFSKIKLEKVKYSRGDFYKFPAAEIEKKFSEIGIALESVLEIAKSQLKFWNIKVPNYAGINDGQFAEMCDHGTDNERLDFKNYMRRLYEMGKDLKEHPDKTTREIDCRFCLGGMGFYCLPCNGNILRCFDCVACFQEHPEFKFCPIHLREAIETSIVDWGMVGKDNDTIGVVCKGGMCHRDFNGRILACCHMFHVNCLYIWVFRNYYEYTEENELDRGDLNIICPICKAVMPEKEWRSILEINRLYEMKVGGDEDFIGSMCKRMFMWELYENCVLKKQAKLQENEDAMREDDEKEDVIGFEDGRGEELKINSGRSEQMIRWHTVKKYERPAPLGDVSMNTLQKNIITAAKEAEAQNAYRKAIERGRVVFQEILHVNVTKRIASCKKQLDEIIKAAIPLVNRKDAESKAYLNLMRGEAGKLNKIIIDIERGVAKYSK